MRTKFQTTKLTIALPTQILRKVFNNYALIHYTYAQHGMPRESFEDLNNP